MKKFALLVFIVIINILPCYAQDIDTISEQVFFDFDQHHLSTKEQQKINALTLKGKLLKVYIEANTDVRGTNKYNIKLGAKRAKTIKNYLLNKKIDNQILQVINHGEARPIALQGNENSHSKNRRVDITIVYRMFPTITEVPKDKEIIEPTDLVFEKKDTNNISKIYKELAIKPETFLIKKEDTILTSKRGTILVIDKNDINCSCKKEEKAIKIELKEVFTKSDMIRERLTTMDNKGQRLESGGMIHLAIFCKNKRTWLSKPIQTLIPSKTFIPGMFAYTGMPRIQQFTGNQGTFKRSSVVWSRIDKKPLRHWAGCRKQTLTEKKCWLIEWWEDIRRTKQAKRALKQKIKQAEVLLAKETKIDSIVNKTIAQNLVKFYVLEIRKVNWINIDKPYFTQLNQPYKNIAINTPVSKSTELSIFVKGRNSAFRAIPNNKKYYFPTTQNEKVKIVGLKISDQNEILLAFQDADSTKDSYDLNFKVYPLKEIKKKLKELDQY